MEWICLQKWSRNNNRILYSWLIFNYEIDQLQTQNSVHLTFALHYIYSLILNYLLGNPSKKKKCGKIPIGADPPPPYDRKCGKFSKKILIKTKNGLKCLKMHFKHNLFFNFQATPPKCGIFHIFLTGSLKVEAVPISQSQLSI